MIARSAQLAKKAESALISAIEIYNKPDFAYREETFSILALNAWELLLKARIVAETGNDPRSVYVYDRRRTKTGEWSKKRYIRRNRAGNPHTMGLSQLVSVLDDDPSSRLSSAIKTNLIALTEIRDNAVHYMNAGHGLKKQVLEIGTASVKNFIELAQRWLLVDLSGYSLFLMPIGFLAAPGGARALSATRDEGNLIRYLTALVSEEGEDQAGGFHVALDVSISLTRSSSDAASVVALTDDPDAPKVQLTEEDIRKKYPWDYKELMNRLRKRYSDFKQNARCHQTRGPLMKDARFVASRLLDPGNPKGVHKEFYNPNILKEFDKHYTRR